MHPLPKFIKRRGSFAASIHVGPDDQVFDYKNDLGRMAKTLWNKEYHREYAKKGPLLKRGNFYKRWQARFCILTREGILFYFKKWTGRQDDIPAGIIFIDDESVLENISGNQMMLGNCTYSFTLKTGRSCNMEGSVAKVFNDRVYYFGTEDEEQFKEWRSCINSFIKKITVKPELEPSVVSQSAALDSEEDSYSTYLKAMNSSMKNSIISGEELEGHPLVQAVVTANPKGFLKVPIGSPHTELAVSLSYKDLTSKSLEIIADDLMKKAELKKEKSIGKQSASSRSKARLLDPEILVNDNAGFHNLEFDFIQCHLERTNQVSLLSKEVSEKASQLTSHFHAMFSNDTMFMADAVESLIEFIPILKEFLFSVNESVLIPVNFHSQPFLESCRDQLIVLSDQTKDLTINSISLIRQISTFTAHKIIPTSNLSDLRPLLEEMTERCTGFTESLTKFQVFLRDALTIDDLIREADKKIIHLLRNSVLISGVDIIDLPGSIVRGLSNNLKSFSRILYYFAMDCSDLCESMCSDPNSVINVFTFRVQCLLNSIQVLVGTCGEQSSICCMEDADEVKMNLNARDKIQQFLVDTEKCLSEWVRKTQTLFPEKQPKILSIEEQNECIQDSFELAIKVIDIVCAVEGILRGCLTEYAKVGNGLLRGMLLAKHSAAVSRKSCTIVPVFSAQPITDAAPLKSPIRNRRRRSTASSSLPASDSNDHMGGLSAGLSSVLQMGSRDDGETMSSYDKSSFLHHDCSGLEDKSETLLNRTSSHSNDLVKSLSLSTFLEECSGKHDVISVNRVICKSLIDLVQFVILSCHDLRSLWYNADNGCNLAELDGDALIDQMSLILYTCQQIDEDSRAIEWGQINSMPKAFSSSAEKVFDEGRRNLFLAVSAMSISLKSMLLGDQAPPDAVVQAEKEISNVQKECENLDSHLRLIHELLSNLISDTIAYSPSESPSKVDDRSETPSDDSEIKIDTDVVIVENLISCEYKRSKTHDIVIQEKDESDPSSKTLIKGGTLKSLVEIMTCERKPDHHVISTILLVYGTFTSASSLLHLLIERYRVDAPMELTEKQKYHYRKKKVIPIRLRVLNVLKMWVKLFYEEFQGDSELLESLQTFMDELRMDFRKGTEDFEMLLEKMKRRKISNSVAPRQFQISRQSGTSFEYLINNPPTPILPKDEREWGSLSAVNSVELARQWTLLDWKFFAAIGPKEFLDQGWNNKKVAKSGNILAMINHANQFVYWMASEIVLTRNIRNRAVLVKHLISTAEKCRLINNFNTLKSILAALNMSGIVRLKKTWELVPQKWKSVYLNLNELMSESKSYKAYRQALTCCEGSCIPFLGVYLSNLVFLEVGNRTYLDEEAGIINFDKQSRIAKIIEEVMTYQRSAYNFQPISQIQKAIQQAKILCEEEIYACSLEIEPRPSHLISPVSHYVPSTVSESQQ